MPCTRSRSSILTQQYRCSPPTSSPSVGEIPRTRASAGRGFSSGRLANTTTGSSSVSSIAGPSANSQEAVVRSDNEPDDDTHCHCPYKTFEGFQDSVLGRGYVKTSILKHIQDRNLSIHDGTYVYRENTHA